MKPWENQCANCGRMGYTFRPVWGEVVCQGGCDPDEVRMFQSEQIKKESVKGQERSQIVEEGAGI